MKKSVISLFILAACLTGCPANHAQVPGPTLDYNVITLAGMAGSPGSADGAGSSARFRNPAGVAVDGAGNVYVADDDNYTIRKIGPGGVVTTLAGMAGSYGCEDGVGSAARFTDPSGVVVDSAGNVYVSDFYSQTIRKIGPGGVVATVAGLTWMPGSADGTRSVAQFKNPTGVAVDSAGNVYVADSGNHTIRKIAPGSVVTTLAGKAGIQGSANGIGNAARFYDPYGVAVDSAGNLYVADEGNCAIRKIGPGGAVTTLAGMAGTASGSADGTGSAARFHYPHGVAVDNAGNVYVADTFGPTIRKIGPGAVVTTLAGKADNPGSADGMGSAARFNFPYGVAADSAGNLYVADSGNHTIRKLFTACPDAPRIDLAAGPVGVSRQLDTAPQTASAWHWKILERPSGSTAALSFPFIRNPTIIPDAEGLYVFQLSATNAAGQFGIRTLDFWACEAPVITLAPASQTAAQGDVIRLQVNARGLLLRYQWLKEGLSLAGKTNAALTLSNIQRSAAGNYTVVVSNPAGSWTSSPVQVTVLLPLTVVVSPGSTAPLERREGETLEFTAAASGGGPWSYQWSKNDVDLIGATNAQIILTNLRYYDSGQYRAKVWSETEMGNASVNLVVTGEYIEDYNVRTLAGKAGIEGSASGIGNAARFYYPYGVAVDSASNLYVADYGNSSIRKIGPGGVVTTLAGKAGSGGSADGTGSAARFGLPYGVVVNSAGNVYMADYGNSTIRQIGPGSVVTTLAGKADYRGSADGTGSAARFWGPLGVAVDSMGNVYVADKNNHTIRQIGPGGVVTTLAGAVGSRGSSDGLGNAADFNGPHGMAMDSAGNLYVADADNHAIRQIGPGGMVTTLAGKAGLAGANDGTGSAARFNHPSGVAVDSAGNVYVADTGNHTIRRIGPGGVVTILAGKAGIWGSADGIGSVARFGGPEGVAVDSAGNIYVSDSGNHTIRKLFKDCPDVPRIDVADGLLGVPRQLDTMPQTAVRWAWQIIQRPAGSTAELSSLSQRNPTFTPDKPGRYFFELVATDPSGNNTPRTCVFTGFDLEPIPPFSLRALRSGPSVILVWTAARDYLLESTDCLGSNAVWTPVPGVTTNMTTLPLGVTNQYFRLRK